MARRSQIESALAAWKRKYARLVRSGVPKSLLPSLPDLTRADAYNNLRSFTNRGNDRYRYIQDSRGEWSTRKEYNELVRKTERAQREANKIIDRHNKRYENEPYHVTGDSGNYRTVGEDSAFEKARKYSRDIRSIDDFGKIRKYFDRVNRISPEYLEQLDAQWMDNFIKAIRDVHGTEGEDLVNTINSLTIQEFAYTVTTNDISIAFVYTDSDRQDAKDLLLEVFKSGKEQYKLRFE